MQYVRLVRAGDTNYMHTSAAWLNDVRRFNLTDCYILDVQDDITEDLVIADLAKKDLTETALDTMTWMGEYGGYRFFACGDEITVYKHKDGTYWCTEQDSEHYFVF
jgi:hypothetical protein